MHPILGTLSGSLSRNISFCLNESEYSTQILNPKTTYPTKERYFVRRQSNPDLSIMYDSRTRNPKWVMEVLPQLSIGEFKADRAKMKFYKDKFIDVDTFQVSPGEFSNSGFSRGHIAPAADFSNSQDAMEATFTMTNISPQSAELNKGYWNQFEAWVRRLKKRYEDVVVITGPAFLPVFIRGQWVYLHQTIGSFPKLIHVPSHFFKVVLVRGWRERDRSGGQSGDQRGDILAIAAFLIPNEHIDSKVGPIFIGIYMTMFIPYFATSLLPVIPLEKFVVKLDDLEALGQLHFIRPTCRLIYILSKLYLVGFKFFEDLFTVEERKYLDSKANSIISMMEELKLTPSEKRLFLPSPPVCRTKSEPDVEIGGGDVEGPVSPQDISDIDSLIAQLNSNRLTPKSTSRNNNTKSLKVSNNYLRHLCEDVPCNFRKSKSS